MCGRIRPTRSELLSTTTAGVSTRVSFFFYTPLTLFNARASWCRLDADMGHRQCFGTTRASPSGSSPGKTFRPISPPLRRFPQIGGRPARSGPRTPATRSRSSRTKPRSSTPLCAATGRAPCGPRRVFRVRNRAAHSEPGSPPANNSCSRTARRFPRLVSLLWFHSHLAPSSVMRCFLDLAD